MTSRETTPLLPLKGGGEQYRRSPKELAEVALFGVIGTPWLLKSLYGGSKAGKARLLRQLGLPMDALPNLGSWKADVGFLQLIADHILAAKPETVVEFGAGATSLIAARALQMNGGGQLLSFDQHEAFATSTQQWLRDNGVDASINYAPLKRSPNGWPGLWYDHGPLPESIDLVLIDGPPWSIHPFVRGAAECVFDRIAPGGTVMLDDAARPGERIVARRWRKHWPQFDFTLSHAGSKGTLVGVRRS